MVGVIGWLAGIFVTIAVIPQILKAIKTGNVNDISPFFFIQLVIGVLLWVIYGIMKSDWPIIITNGVSLTLNSYMLIIYFTNKK
ncbi:SemiSWEET transporter [Galbibacter sp. BG1]|uniref:SemiSWEET family sugar transporter n=1 Tax=Galbibacter sp. BG1 TaxID=1170699 RepID=UPI0015BBCC23|nr:SemiSWEET transporter [Galbibacter sp. BG1]QLE02852.1 SemiSWEET transporter [Galbibacter sp. BG1]